MQYTPNFYAGGGKLQILFWLKKEMGVKIRYISYRVLGPKPKFFFLHNKGLSPLPTIGTM